MQRQRRKDTEPELLIRRALHRAGLRYRVGVPVPGLRRRTIDIAFTRIKLAVFVDGCFWHGCPEHATWPKANAGWWEAKILKNRSRDRETNVRLQEAGWRVVRIWEHEPPDQAATHLLETVAVLRGDRPGADTVQPAVTSEQTASRTSSVAGQSPDSHR
jgi:DNA mismatch endonuclease (patch repair protein)